MKHPHWSSHEIAALRALVKAGDSYREAARKLSARFGRVVTREAVHSVLTRLNSKRDTDPAPRAPAAASFEDEPPTQPRVAPASPSSSRSLDDDGGGQREAVARIVELTRRAPLSIEALCDELDLAPWRVRELVESANETGYRVELDGGHVGRRPHDESEVAQHSVSVSGADDRRVIAAVGDIHFGSKHHLVAYFQDYCRYAYDRGAREFLHVGDLLDGVYKHSVWEQSARGYEEQVAVAVEELPSWPDARWHFIQGNHDETLGEASGLDVGRAIVQSFVAAGRTDVHYLGARGAYVRLVGPGERRGLFVELWHPRDKGNAYAKSYRMQKHIESYAPGQKPDLLLTGHWHQQMYFTTRGVHALSTGCWQGGQSSFGKSIGGAPAIGSWVIEYGLTPEGTVRHIRPEWCGYFEKEHVRDVELG